jgi:hypothetical protein
MNTKFQREQQSDRNMLDVVILIINDCMVHFYAYWKDGKRLRKRYIGKTIGDLLVRKVAKKADTTPTKMRKLKVIKEKAQSGNLLGHGKTQKRQSQYRLGLQSTSE